MQKKPSCCNICLRYQLILYLGMKAVFWPSKKQFNKIILTQGPLDFKFLAHLMIIIRRTDFCTLFVLAVESLHYDAFKISVNVR